MMYRRRNEKLPKLPKRRIELLHLPSTFSQFVYHNSTYNIVISNDIVGSLNESETSIESENSSSQSMSVANININSSQQQSEASDEGDESDELISDDETDADDQEDEQVNDQVNENENDEGGEIGNEEEEEEMRCIILGVEENLRYLHQNEPPGGPVKLFGDGTFKSCPKLFYQVYTIHARVRKQLFPIIYALLPKKDVATYTHLLQVIKLKINELFEVNWEPEFFQIDYERPMMNAITTVLPSTQVKGCYFHYTQAIVKRVTKKLKLGDYYCTHGHRVRKVVRYCMILTLLPLYRFTEAMNIIEGLVNSVPVSSPFRVQLRAFLSYYRSTWFGQPGRTPRFNKEIWNQYNVFQDRTNNRLEAFHRNFRDSIGAPHKNIWCFLNQVTKDLAFHQSEMSRLSHGGRVNYTTGKDEEAKNNVIAFEIERLEHDPPAPLLDVMDNLAAIID